MILTVQGEKPKGGATLGRLYVDGVAFCDTLEDQVREVPGAPVAAWKVPGETAIPAGSYQVTLDYSQRFGHNTMTVNAVPGFSAIRIHAGNTKEDTHGCLLVGLRNTDRTISDSRVTLTGLKIRVMTAMQLRDGVTIEYHNPPQDD